MKLFRPTAFSAHDIKTPLKSSSPSTRHATDFQLKLKEASHKALLQQEKWWDVALMERLPPLPKDIDLTISHPRLIDTLKCIAQDKSCLAINLEDDIF